MAKLEEFYDDEDEFDALLCKADTNCDTAVEDNFVSDMINKFEKYRLQMFITTKQINWLEKLAARPRRNAG